MMAEAFSWIVTIVGCFGFWLGGKKIWWSWYVNIANQLAWVMFALITGYYAFLVGTAFYLTVFVRNAYLWTNEHFASPRYASLLSRTAGLKKARNDVGKYYRDNRD